MAINLSNKKTQISVEKPEIRAKNFKEVSFGYTEDEAVNEANRCLGCKNPMCIQGCPVNIKIPQFIEKVKARDFEAAYEIISQTSSLPAICGRVCPQESQCESKCLRGLKGEPVAIGRLERFVADWHNENCEIKQSVVEKNGYKVAVVGSGPSGLACASDLLKKGYDVTIFEALHKLGGVLTYGIPEFRLPKTIVKKEIDNLTNMGAKFETNVVIGKTIFVQELFDEGFSAVFIGTGAGLPKFMGIRGENLNGVLSANEFLTRANLMNGYKTNSETPIFKGGKFAVVGGGNVAMDAARTALRLGADEVYIVYRRSKNELPARAEEIEHALEEGIILDELTNPIEIIGDNLGDKKTNKRFGFVKQLKCVKMELGEPDEKGRRKPVVIKGSEFLMDVDYVIMAIGTAPNPLIKNTTSGLDINSHGGIVVDENGKTSLDGVFAGGDSVTGAATVISAMGAGKVAARSIDKFIKNKFSDKNV